MVSGTRRACQFDATWDTPGLSSCPREGLEGTIPRLKEDPFTGITYCMDGGFLAGMSLTQCASLQNTRDSRVIRLLMASLMLLSIFSELFHVVTQP